MACQLGRSLRIFLHTLHLLYHRSIQAIALNSRRCTLLRYTNHLVLLCRAQTRLSTPRSSVHSLPEVYNNPRSHGASSSTGTVHTPTPSASTPSCSSYPASLGYPNSDRHREPPRREPLPARDASVPDVAALKATMEGLGVELPDQVIAGLAQRYDGMTPLERFLSEEGYWVPGSRGQADHHEGGTYEGRHRRA